MSSPSLEDILGVSPTPDPPTPDLNIPADTPAPTLPQGVTPEQYAEQQRKLDEVTRKNDELERRISSLPQERTPQNIPTQIQPGISPQEAKQQLEAQYLADPVGFLMQFGNLLAAQVENKIRKEQQPYGTAITSSAVENFKRSMAADPMFASAEKRFDELVQAESANLDPARIGQQLDALYSTAYGDVLRHRKPDGRDNEPPRYATGGAGGSADTGGGMPNGGRKLTEEDRIYIETMRDSGYDDKKIAEMMKARNA